ncbi:mas-related G-protein coupled receptor member A1-like isoform X2 [Vidua macroura]|uniref:mas-related G-protein coupled receptor member A1-like isoform X2 n=1 Tax=Vidua macroura TaxID=187451 RepID=UPI0023A859B4|nr:mas-related G-protein coupled receptor member A1-like isoform X2 [Vidua macroura]
MEVSTVSPSPTSPTDGPGQCETNVSNVATDLVTLLFGLCGLVGNGAFLWLLQINSITDFVAFNQASIDFLFLIFMVPSTLLFLLAEVSCSAKMPPMYLSLLSQLSLFTYTMGLYQLMFISIERCRSILCLFFCTGQRSEHLRWVVMSGLFWALFFVVTAVNPTVTSLCQSHEQEQCQVALISRYALNLCLVAVPLLISSTILFIHFKPGSQQQQYKRLNIVIVLIAIFSLPLSLCSFLQQLGYTVVPSQAVFLLTCITSSIKPFICFLVGSWKRDCSMGSCWRHCSMGSWKRDCSMGSCWRHCSMGSWRKNCSVESLRKAIRRVFGEPKENTASSNDPAMDTEA